MNIRCQNAKVKQFSFRNNESKITCDYIRLNKAYGNIPSLL